ncbi:MAG: HAD-IC family P-type ATPase, partial [Deltaproteobacteria bacterium]|nr:HAD-IC family P-type ATPase [Deltaproteobacteria bacterium]
MEVIGILKAAIPDIKAQNHEGVLRELFGRLFPGKKAVEENVVFCDLRAHESTEGALSGTGAAIFHCLAEDADVKDGVIGVAVSKKGVPAPGPARPARSKGAEREPVRIFFLLVSPIRESGAHLQMLSNLEWLLLDKGLRRSLIAAKSADEIRKAILRGAGSAKTAYMPLERDDVLKELKTSEKGITSAEAARRLELVGWNTLKKAARVSLLKDFLENLFLNLFALLLWAGGVMSFIGGMPELGWAIFLVIVINAAFSFMQEYKAERAVEALLKLLPKKVRVIRDGREKEIDATALVPGDLILLEEGDSVPADGRLIDAEDMRVDNSALTGESKPVYKTAEPLMDGTGFIWTEVPNMVFAGTGVLSGIGRMVVTSTGMDTEIGRVAYLTQAIKAEKSPLQKEMANITKTVTMIAVGLGLLFFVLGYRIAGLTFAESFIFAVGIIVANVPEGLLPTVSLSLAMGVQRMANKKAIVKKLSAVETLGSATVICTDKTGTLTQNQMCVTRLYANMTVIEVSGSGYDPAGGFHIGRKELESNEITRLGITRLLIAGALCNNASLTPPSKETPYWTISGDPTEGALLTAAEKAGLDLDALKAKNPRAAHLA